MIEMMEQKLLFIQRDNQELKLCVREKTQEVESLHARIEETQNTNPEA